MKNNPELNKHYVSVKQKYVRILLSRKLCSPFLLQVDPLMVALLGFQQYLAGQAIVCHRGGTAWGLGIWQVKEEQRLYARVALSVESTVCQPS